MKQPAPRCPKCGSVPGIRRYDADAKGRITVTCTRGVYRDGSSKKVQCGEVYVIEVDKLAEDVKLTTDADAA